MKSILRFLPDSKFKIVILILIFPLIALFGCATTNDHHLAFSEKTALTGNSDSFDLSANQTMAASKAVLIKQGFTIDSVDVTSGIVKANRNLQDPDDQEYAYHITVSGLLVEEGPRRTLMTLSATQQTILHKKYTTWWKLLWMIPLFPVETKYETIVVKEGNIEEKRFYSDFFKAVKAQGELLKEAEKKSEKSSATP